MQIARFAPANLHAALWALRALRSARSALPAHGVDSGRAIPAAPASTPDSAIRGVRAVLARRGATCLERALILQAWHRAHGEHQDLIVGVTAPGEDFRAHAWLEGDDPCHEGDFSELIRRRAPDL